VARRGQRALDIGMDEHATSLAPAKRGDERFGQLEILTR
jgi:hypothetical protein